MFRHALIPLHLREPPWRLRALLGYLHNFGTESLVLVHVVASGLGNVAHARRRLERMVETAGAEPFETEVVVRSGSPALEISNVAAERNLDFICMPWRKKDFLQRTLLGSTSEDVVRLADVPVFVHKPTAGDGERLDSILYATTFNPLHDRILAYLKYDGLAASTLFLLHVGRRAPDPEAEKNRRQRIFQELDHVMEQCRDCFDTIKPITEVGNPRWKISRVAGTHDVDLIVLGKMERASGLGKTLGSTAETTTHRSRCSILIVPAALERRHEAPEEEHSS